MQVALCGMRCNNDKLEIQENFKKHIIKIEKNLRIWSMIDLSIAGKITVFKTLAISKIVHLALVKTIPNPIIQEFKKNLYGKLAILKQNMTLSVKIMKMEVSKMLTSCT